MALEEGKFTVKEVETVEKSAAQKEAEVLSQHEQKNEKPVDEIKEEIKEEIKPSEEDKIVEQPIELKDEDILGALSKKLNKPITSFDDLKEELPEDVATFYKYKKETGRGMEDFIKLNRDYSKMSDDDKLFEYLSATEEGLDPDDIEAMIDELKVDEDLDLETEINKKNRQRKKTLTEANKFFEKQKEQYKLPLVSSEATVSETEKEEFESYKQYIQKAKDVETQNAKKGEWFEKKTNEVFSNEFKGFEFKVKVGEEDKSLVFSTGTPDELKSLQSSPLNFINKFMDENGMIKDAVGYHKALSVAMNTDKFAQYFIEQGYAMATESNDRKIKNINMSTRPASTPLAREGIKVQEVPAGQSFGNGLKVLSVKKVQ